MSPIGLAPRRGFSGAVIAPLAPAPFINPAVIHRTATLLAAEQGRPPQPFRYREGMAFGGAAATLPGRWAMAGALSATQRGLRGLTRARTSIRRPLAHGATPERAGCLTPAMALGTACAERFERAGARFSLDS